MQNTVRPIDENHSRFAGSQTILTAGWRAKAGRATPPPPAVEDIVDSALAKSSASPCGPAMDSTKDWFAVVRTLRQPSAKDEANQAPTVALRAGGFSSAAEAVVGSRWRTPLTPFMQQATELNYGIRDMHTFLLEHFLDYVDVHHWLPSKQSLMTADEKDLIDLEVTSFMTACAAGVDALKALLQRERLRRIEQEAAAARATEEDGQGLHGGGGEGGVAGELRPGSRPAHEHAAVTFLFERLKAVTEVAETMQNERHRRAAARNARFYCGPAESRRDGTTCGTTTDDDTATAAARRARPEDVWKRTPEELEEERLLEASLPAAYGNSTAVAVSALGGRGADASADSITHADRVVAAAAASLPSPLARSSSVEPLPPSTSATASSQENAASKTAASKTAWLRNSSSKTKAAPENRASKATAAAKRAEAKLGGSSGDGEGRHYQSTTEERRKQAGQTGGVISGTASAVKRWTGGVIGGVAEEAGGEGGAGSVVPANVLEGENRALVARLKNELDDARLVETKMSEISGLMGLFASKVVEQQGGMEHVFDAAVSANDKLVRGGQHLEKAMERGGAFRLFYAWFMMGASFCLLFLHFYTP